MKVERLIKKLSELPPDTEISFQECSDDEIEKMIDLINEDKDEIPGIVNIKEGSFTLLPLKPNI